MLTSAASGAASDMDVAGCFVWSSGSFTSTEQTVEPRWCFFVCFFSLQYGGALK